ncbi:MAG: DUF4234 domain-containing protein, partial [Candidatus Kapabacteria bacterium]|nr:DUF4234 domain-containing protein [Candidatus Kapabacteria bacterium]
MEGNYPISREEAVQGIVSAILLSIVTCGIYSLFWRAKQFRVINAWLGREEHSFLKYFLLTIVTCGIYGIYYEYKYAVTMVETQRMHNKETNDSLPLLA